MSKRLGFFIFAIVVLGLAIGVVSAQEVTELRILWAEWDPANYLQEMGNQYEEETGIKVTVIQEPWGSFYDLMAAEWAAQGDAYDMVVGDSQWIMVSKTL